MSGMNIDIAWLLPEGYASRGISRTLHGYNPRDMPPDGGARGTMVWSTPDVLIEDMTCWNWLTTALAMTFHGCCPRSLGNVDPKGIKRKVILKPNRVLQEIPVNICSGGATSLFRPLLWASDSPDLGTPERRGLQHR